MNIQPSFLDVGWLAFPDGNDAARALFDRHYSRRHIRRPRVGAELLLIGPGDKMLLLHASGRAIFAWRRYIDDTEPPQDGVECTIFRNDGAGLSSSLIREADARADARWPGERHYTKVDPTKVASGLPGYCFLRAGWRTCGWTKGGLRLLEKPGREPA